MEGSKTWMSHGFRQLLIKTVRDNIICSIKLCKLE